MDFCPSSNLRIKFVFFPSPRIISLVLSFPLLEDLTLVVDDTSANCCKGPDMLLPIAQPSNPPAFTGSLKLPLNGGMGAFVRQLLSSPGGIHFWTLDLTWFREEDISLMTPLVAECSYTLESLNIARSFRSRHLMSALASMTYPRFYSSRDCLQSTPQCDKTQRCRLSTQITEHRMNHPVAPNHHT